MRGAWGVAACMGLSVVVSGCDPSDKAYFRGGIGTELYTADIAAATDLQNVYLDNLCRQSMSYVGAVPSCSERELLPQAWPLMVQAGMNDIDLRCDSYLSWLDQKKRENSAILSEISAIRVAVDALANPAVTGVSPIALAAVAAAFGLATSTLGNINSLLLQVDHTTVQSVVFINRRDFREKLLEIPINNKPMAVHALRSYLTICMPMTIAANINSTVTVFQQAGPLAVDKRKLVSTTTLGSPITATEKLVRRERPVNVVVPEFAEILDPYDPQSQSVAFVSGLQRALCAPKNEIGVPGPITKGLIAIFEASPHPKTVNNGKLDAKEISLIRGQGPCVEGGGRNYFEKLTYPVNDPDGAEALSQLIIALNKVPGGVQLAANTSLDGARDRIAQVRADPTISSKLKLQLPPELSKQVTRDFLLALPR